MYLFARFLLAATLAFAPLVSTAHASDAKSAADAKTITVFAATEYAPAHQFGFDGLVTVPTHNRRIEQAFGKPLPFPVITTVKEHQARRRLPARPYLGMSAEEVDEIEALVDNLAAEALP